MFMCQLYRLELCRHALHYWTASCHRQVLLYMHHLTWNVFVAVVSENTTKPLISFILFSHWGFSCTDTFMVIWRLPAITVGGRPHTHEYRNIRMYGLNHRFTSCQLENLPTWKCLPQPGFEPTLLAAEWLQFKDRYLLTKGTTKNNNGWHHMWIRKLLH